tara:strand:- start:5200 stop:6075 length:876 start_codon:yes stop_codon:yes gene_type:complete
MSEHIEYVINPDSYRQQIANVMEDILPLTPIQIHTDLARIGLIGSIKNHHDMLKEHYDYLIEAIGPDREVIFPTFNYDFPKTKTYDVMSDPCQVGILNEYVRKLNPTERTLTPMFNFVILNRHMFPLSCSKNTVGSDSIFGLLAKNHGELLFFGSLFEQSFTFIHYIEDLVDVPYRYPKRFKGVVIHPTGKKEVEISYRVQPLKKIRDTLNFAIEYDISKCLKETENHKLIARYPLGNGFCIRLDAFPIASLFKEILENDPFYFLTAVSKKAVLKVLEKLGGRMTFENMEG